MGRLTAIDQKMIQDLEQGCSFFEIGKQHSLTIPEVKQRVYWLLETHPNCFHSCKDQSDLALWKEELALGRFVDKKKEEFFREHKGIRLTSLHYDVLTNLPLPGMMLHLKQVAPYFNYLTKCWSCYNPMSYRKPKANYFVGSGIGKHSSVKTITLDDYYFIVSYLAEHDFTVNRATVQDGLFYYASGNLHQLTKEDIGASLGLEKPFQLEKRIIGGKYQE